MAIFSREKFEDISASKYSLTRSTSLVWFSAREYSKNRSKGRVNESTEIRIELLTRAICIVLFLLPPNSLYLLSFPYPGYYSRIRARHTVFSLARYHRNLYDSRLFRIRWAEIAERRSAAWLFLRPSLCQPRKPAATPSS